MPQTSPMSWVMLSVSPFLLVKTFNSMEMKMNKTIKSMKSKKNLMLKWLW